MKKILYLFICLFWFSVCQADLDSWMGQDIDNLDSIDGASVSELESWAGQTVPSGGTVLIHELSLDDNAATTTVVNNGTGASWTAEDNTSVYHSETYIEGTGAFNQNVSGYALSSGENWTSEKFTVEYWVYLVQVTSYDMVQWQIGTGNDTPTAANQMGMKKLSTDDEMHVLAYDTSLKTISTTDFNPSTSTWYRIKTVIDASVSPWTVAMAYSTDGTNYTDLTMGSWDAAPSIATFNSKMWISSTGTHRNRATVDYLTAEDTE